MKVLILYTHNKGFLSQFYQGLSRMLHDEGYDVVNVSFKNSCYQETNNGVKLYSYKRKGYITNYVRIFKIIKKTKPDIVLSNFSYVNPALVFGKLFKVKKNIVWFHSLKEQMNPPKYKLVVKSCFLKLADKVIANSKLTQEELFSIYYVPKQKIISIPFWSTLSEVEKKSFNIPQKNINDFKIGCPGRLVSHKNQKVILQAIAKINNHSLKVYFAGSGEDEKKLKVLASNLNIGNQVIFLGNLTTPEMKYFYNEMDVIVLPSLYEAFGLVLIEAMESNVKILVSNAFGALKFIDSNKYNFEECVFDPNNSVELSQKLLSIISDRNLAGKLNKEVYHKTFDKTTIFENILKEFKI